MKFIFLFLFILSAHAEEKFSERAWSQIKTIYQQILTHPFNQELANGTLQKNKYIFYKQQDAYYLIYFNKALVILASKLNTSQDIKLVLRFAEGSLDEIQQTPSKEITPTNFTYTHFLMSTAANGSAGELAAALLPCFWIYAEVGKELKKISSAKNPYQEWIDTYSSSSYNKSVDEMIDLANRLFQNATDQEKKKMLDNFAAASRLEFDFWDDAFKINYPKTH